MKKRRLLSLLLASVALMPVHATQTPKAYASDGRITHVPYQDNNVVSVRGKFLTTTQFVFGNKERILDIEGGDRDGWVVTHHENLPNIMFVKPTVLNSNTNITVITTYHTYYFHTTSQKQLKSGERPVYAVKFTYPDEARLPLKATNEAQKRHRMVAVKANKTPKTYNWSYSYNGDMELKPVHVFDDGVFTYFEISPNQPMPAIFIVDNQRGEEAVSNLRRQGAYLVVHRTAPQFTLRMGKNHVGSVFNNREIARIKGRRVV